MATAEIPRRWAWPALAAVLAAGLGLRLWGIRQGLPYAYNADEADHFVPHAVDMFAHGLNPHYFANPPALTYLLHVLFAIAYDGKAGVLRTFALHPAAVYTLSRVAVALLGVAALWLLYATGARLLGRAVGLLAAAIEAVAFLPVFYSHLALNDVPALAPLTLSLLGSAGVVRRGRKRDYLLAGAGLGLACATKYTAGIAVVPFGAAVALRYLDGEAASGRRALSGIALALAVALGAFLIANPYAVLDYGAFHGELIHQSTLSAEAQGKLGAPKHGGVVYYLWSLTWGLGWVPALAALGGAVSVWRGGPSSPLRAVGWLLVPGALAFLAFMGLQGRYFGRWLMPVLPILCLLGAVFLLQTADALWALASGRRGGGKGGAAPAQAARAHAPSEGSARSPARVVAVAALVAAGLAQGVLHSVHSGLVLSRADTRNLARAWMLTHVPVGAKIVAEPVSPDEWAHETRPGTSTAANRPRWNKYASLLSRISPSGAISETSVRLVGIESYETTLLPALIGYYERHGYCWVISGSTQSGRAFADARAVPGAIAYYRALARQGELLYRASPYASGHGAVAFGFDWSFDYYPLAYHRPGPEMSVYRLRAGRCGR